MLGVGIGIGVTGHYVDVITPTVSSMVLGSLADNRIVITCSEALDTGSVPAVGDFTLAGISVPIDSVSVQGSTVWLILKDNVPDNYTLTLSYTAGANPIQDAAGNALANFATQSVTNSSSDHADVVLSVDYTAIDQNVSDCENTNYDVFTNVSPTSFNAAKTTSGTKVAGTADEISFVSGQKYTVSFNMVLNSGQAPDYNLHANLAGTAITDESYQEASAGANVFEFTANQSTIGVLQFNNSSNTNYEITNLSVSSPVQFVFKWKAPAGNDVTFHEGDGTTQTVSGADSTLKTTTTSYSGAGTYDVWLSGDENAINYIDINGQAFVSGNLNAWAARMSGLTVIDVSSTAISGNGASCAALSLTSFLFDSTSVTWDSAATMSLTSATVNAANSGMSTTTMVDNFINSFEDSTGCTFDVSGTNAHRTSASNDDLNTLLANGNTITLNDVLGDELHTSLNAANDNATEAITAFADYSATIDGATKVTSAADFLDMIPQGSEENPDPNFDTDSWAPEAGWTHAAGVYTCDGTNNRCTFNATADIIILLGISSTRWLILKNISVALSAV